MQLKSLLIYCSGLLDVHARNSARNDQTLNFRSPFEDRVGIGVAHKYPSEKFFPNWRDPRITEIDPFTGGLGRFCTRLVGASVHHNSRQSYSWSSRTPPTTTPSVRLKTASGRRTTSP